MNNKILENSSRFNVLIPRPPSLASKRRGKNLLGPSLRSREGLG